MSVTPDSSLVAFSEDASLIPCQTLQFSDDNSDDEDNDQSCESGTEGLIEQFPSLVTLTEKAARVNQLSAKLSRVRQQIEEKRRCLTDMYSPYIKLDNCNGSSTAFKDALQFLADQKSLELSACLREVSVSKQRCDSERLASKLENRRPSCLSYATSSPEFQENRTLEEIQKARVGHVERIDDSHLLLDVSQSSLFPTSSSRSDHPLIPTSPDTLYSTDGLSTRLRARIISERGLPCQRLDDIHPLYGTPSTMQLARLASESQVPSLISNAMLWQYIAHAHEKEPSIRRETD
ncbi:hypothetical protein AAHC03_026088 [Spirometra sp. Aus1]